MEKNHSKYQESQMNSLRWDYRNEFMMHRGSQVMDTWVAWDLELTSWVLTMKKTVVHCSAEENDPDPQKVSRHERDTRKM